MQEYSDETPRLLVLAALRREAVCFARALGAHPIGRARSRWRTGDGVVEVRVIGPGATAMPSITAPEGVSWVVVAGLAGGLDPALRTGEVVVDAPPRGFHPSVPWRAGGIHTSEGIISTPGEKRALHERTGASVVDMEQAHVRAAIAGSDIRLCGVRAVLDPADERLPPYFSTLVDARGRTRMMGVARALLPAPWRAARLVRTALDARFAMMRAAAVVDALAGAIRESSQMPSTETPAGSA